MSQISKCLGFLAANKSIIPVCALMLKPGVKSTHKAQTGMMDLLVDNR